MTEVDPYLKRLCLGLGLFAAFELFAIWSESWKLAMTGLILFLICAGFAVAAELRSDR